MRHLTRPRSPDLTVRPTPARRSPTRHDGVMNPDEFTVGDLLGCAGADLTDVARRVADLPPDVQVTAAVVELATVTVADDPLSQQVGRLLDAVAAFLTGLPPDLGNDPDGPAVP